MSGAAAEAAATLRWPADAAERIDRLTSRWRAFVADGIDALGRDMPAIAACRSSLSEAAATRVLRSPCICHGVRTGDVSLWAPPILAEWASENDARCEAWTALGDIWTGSERPPDALALTCDGRVWRGARLACGIPLDQSLDVSLSCPAAGLHDPRRPTAAQEHRIVALLDAAIALIDAACPEAGTAVRAATSNVVLRVDPQSPAPVRSASSAAALGRTVIVLNGVATPEALAEAMVHEAGHTLLSCAELDAPMVTNSADACAAISPWTGAALPAQAFLHACVIWSSLLAFWRRAAARGVATDHAQERIAWIARGFEGGALDRQRKTLAPVVSASGRAVLEQIAEGEFVHG